MTEVPGAGKPEYESYLESWDKNYMQVLQKMDIRSGVVIDIAFGNFQFTQGQGKETIGGLKFTPQQLEEVINYIHSKGGQVKLSLGGATYPLGPTLQKVGPSQLAQEVASAISQYGFDGVDLDIEDNPNPSQEIDFIKNLRTDLGPNKTISLTVPGQDWSGTASQVIPAVKDDVNYFNFMEYDIWVDPSKGFVGTIESDIEQYEQKWGLNPNQIQLGLMPGTDDSGKKSHYLSPQDAQELATWAKQHGLAGVMTWDLDRDYEGKTGQKPFTYTTDIMNTLFGK